MRTEDRRGATLIELVIVIVLTGILAVAFSKPMAPLMNSLLYYPQTTRVSNSATDAIETILVGDEKAKGLRFAGPPCTIGGAGGGGSTITAATATSITYHYVNADYCGSSAARTSRTVALTFDAANHVITRAIDGGTAENIPYYVGNTSDINLDPPAGVNLFRYFNNLGTEMSGAGINVLAIYRVDVTLISASGSGVVTHNAGQTLLKSGVNIKRYVTAPTPCSGTGVACVSSGTCCSGSCVV